MSRFTDEELEEKIKVYFEKMMKDSKESMEKRRAKKNEALEELKKAEAIAKKMGINMYEEMEVLKVNMVFNPMDGKLRTEISGSHNARQFFAGLMGEEESEEIYKGAIEEIRETFEGIGDEFKEALDERMNDKKFMDKIVKEVHEMLK